MSETRSVEIFSAGCPICEQTVEMVRRIACESCEIEVLDLSEESIARRAASLGIRSVPAVVVDGKLARCCEEGGVSEEALLASGIGQPLS